VKNVYTSVSPEAGAVGAAPEGHFTDEGQAIVTVADGVTLSVKSYDVPLAGGLLKTKVGLELGAWLNTLPEVRSNVALPVILPTFSPVGVASKNPVE
jgi:hypothetical protein